MKKKIMIVFGTRPEAIKMCPLVKELKEDPQLEVKVCVTGQHEEMLTQVLDLFEVVPDYNLHVMKESQTLFDITIEILEHMQGILREEKPDLVLVHGDTSTTFSAALSCFYLGIPAGHVEAGLRTYDIHSPFPEEFNRQAVGILTALNFAPTQRAKENLLREGKRPETIFVTGNTAIDALKTTIRQDFTNETVEWSRGKRLIVLTAHRRENLGDPLRNIFRAVKRIVEEFPDVCVVYPVHLNPAVREAADEVLSGISRVRLVEPMDTIEFHNVLAHADFILTDSGGIQEEAPSLGKPVLVVRDTTERPEGIEAGTLKLVGTKEEDVYREMKTLLTDTEAYEKMSKASNPYGDGFACRYIHGHIRDFFSLG